MINHAYTKLQWENNTKKTYYTIKTKNTACTITRLQKKHTLWTNPMHVASQNPPSIEIFQAYTGELLQIPVTPTNLLPFGFKRQHKPNTHIFITESFLLWA